MELLVESRVRQADLELGIVFGYPWYVSPPEASGAVQELGGFAHQADHDKQTRTLRGLGASLQRAQEALLCRCAVRRHFEDAPRLPPNVGSLLQSRFVLWPSSERPDVLLLKCVASAAQMVRPPPPAEHEAEDSAEAAELLATTPLLGSFNPFFHCRGGGSAKVLALCAAGVGSGAQRQQPGSARCVAAAGNWHERGARQRHRGETQRREGNRWRKARLRTPSSEIESFSKSQARDRRALGPESPDCCEARGSARRLRRTASRGAPPFFDY